jgi:hypothetical protein
MNTGTAKLKKLLREANTKKSTTASGIYTNSHSLYSHIRMQVLLTDDLPELKNEVLEYFDLILSEVPDEIIKKIGLRAYRS